MHKSVFAIFLRLITAGTLLFHCSTPQRIAGGNSSETVIGKVSNADGSPACSVVVSIFPADYNPVTDDIDKHLCTGITDDNGSYILQAPESGPEYMITAKSIVSGTRALITGIRMHGDTVFVHDAVLRKTGTVKVSVPENTDSDGEYVYVPGTELVVFIDNAVNQVTLDSVPPGVIPRIMLSSDETAAPSEIRDSIVVEPGETVVVAHPEWNHACRLYLNTSTDGASVSGDVYRFPVCVRLTEDVFDFTRAEVDGKDMRFSTPDGSLLPFEIERWDAENHQATVWVAVDTVYGNSATQYIVMYWGNPAAENGSVGGAAFDTAAGFQGVWHLAGNGNAMVNDATWNRFDGTPYHMSDSSSVPGIAGRAFDFDGVDDFIAARGTADGKLDFKENGTYSVSLWAYADEVDSLWHGIAGKGHHQYYLQYKCFLDTAASWEFVEFQNEGGWNYSEYRTNETPRNGVWVYLTGIRNGDRQYLYVNGKLVVDTIRLNSSENNRDTDGDFVIGCHLQYDMLPDIVPMPQTFFNGKIDEVRVMNAVPDDNWIRLCYMNQKEEDALVEFR